MIFMIFMSPWKSCKGMPGCYSWNMDSPEAPTFIPGRAAHAVDIWIHRVGAIHLDHPIHSWKINTWAWKKGTMLLPVGNFQLSSLPVQNMPGSLLCELWPSECYIYRTPKCLDANHVLRCQYRTMPLHALLGGTLWNPGSEQCSCGIGSKRARG